MDKSRATFESIKTDDPDLFVVRISGHLGTRQRPVVENLVQKCRDKGKDRVVFDFSALESMGGSVARVLGAFAAELSRQGHGPWFIGASPVVQSFLTARFDSVMPNFADDLHTAQVALSGRPVLQRDGASAPAGVDDDEALAGAADDVPDDLIEGGAADAGPDDADDADDAGEVDALDAEAIDTAIETLSAEELLAEDEERPEDEASADDAPSKERPPVPASAPPDEGVTRRHSYLTLVEAEPLLVEIGRLRDAKPILDGLLHGADLAETCELFCVEGDHLEQIGGDAVDEPLRLPGSGAVSTVLRRRAAPVDLVDITDMDLAEQESDVLTELNCQVAVPVFVNDTLEGVFFVRKSTVGEEYVSSEELALDLLARQVGHLLGEGRRRGSDEVSAEEKKLRAQLRRQRTVLRLCRELHDIEEEEQLVSRLLISLIGEMGVGAAAYLVFEHGDLVARHAYGIEEDELGPMAVPAPARVRELDEMLLLERADAQVWGDALVDLDKLGFDVLMPLRSEEELFGVLALATRRAQAAGNFDPDYLKSLIHQAGVAAENVRAVRELEDHILHVAKTLIALIEKRIGPNTTASTELVTWYTARVAEALNYDPEHRRDLLYGAVLRDVGMIEISDLVLKSPRSLTPEEWKLVQRHPISGVDILRSMHFSDVTCDVVLHHHERFNGEGYPHGLRGTAIPQGARIVSVVESFVAMIRDTPYRPALSEDEALAVLEENWEMRYDPVVVETFVQVHRSAPAPSDIAEMDSLLAG